MIRAERLTKCFGSLTAISDVSFEVERGEIVGFLGPNGAGKTTTMRILGGVFPPTSGQAVVAGYDVVADALRARSVVGYFPERVSLYLDMTTREYLQYVAEMKGIARREQRAEIDPLDVGGDGLPQRPGVVLAGAGFGVERIGVRRPAAHPELDDRACLGLARGRAGTERPPVSERQADRAPRPSPQEVPPPQPIRRAAHGSSSIACHG